ncbi:MAG TPA: RNA polymerase sigma factor [Steroidobacteraceae bacterium]|nr:RNA polymerase sigma factor [Steroidobacteraceae bacterium]
MCSEAGDRPVQSGGATGERAAGPGAADEDARLARRVLAGDRSAFELLMRRYNRRLYRLARASLGDDAEAQDALQDAYLCAYRSLGQFRGDAALSTWLSRLVLNACGARRRRSLRRASIVPIVGSNYAMDALAAVPDSGDQPDRLAARSQIRSVLERKVSELPEDFRIVFVLRSVEELSVEEIADTLELSPETVRSRHFRARGMLRASLAKDIDLAEGDVFEFGGGCCDRMVARVLAILEQRGTG